MKYPQRKSRSGTHYSKCYWNTALAGIVVFCMIVVSVLPAGRVMTVSAAQAQASGGLDIVYVNPLYRDVYSPADVSQRMDAAGGVRQAGDADSLKDSLDHDPDNGNADGLTTIEEEMDANQATVLTNNDQSSQNTTGEALLASGTAGSLNSPVNRDEAAAFIRQEQVNKAEEITVYLSGEQSSEDVSRLWEESQKHTGVPEEGDYLHYDFMGVRMRTWFSESQDTTMVRYQVTYYTTPAQEEQLTAAINDTLSSLSLEGRSDYGKVFSIYNYICSHVSYDNANASDRNYTLKYTAYAALIEGTAVCQGYASLLYRMCLQEGIDTRVIPGTSRGQGHAWNIVQLGERYYNVDSTWDAGRTADAWNCFLVNDAHLYDHARRAGYDTETFYAQYPMSTEDYTPTEDDLRIHFTDVYDPYSYYYEPVYWARDKDIVSGMTNTRFGVGRVCTRAQMITMLYQYWNTTEWTDDKTTGQEAAAVSRQDLSAGDNIAAIAAADAVHEDTRASVSFHGEDGEGFAFGDVPDTAYYYEAVAWAVQGGITSGTSATTFSPNNTCSRAQIITMLYRTWLAAGNEELTDAQAQQLAAGRFTDVPENAFYFNAVAWALEYGITSGTNDGTTFSPGQPCTREQAVAMLYRAFH